MEESSNLDSSEDLEQEEAIQEAVFQFNTNPKEGVLKLCEVHNLQPTPRNISNLMHTVPGLLGDKIGEFLSRRENQPILQYYFDKFNLKCPFIPALRVALSGSLRLPGEGELIDHVVEAFATIYTSQNPGAFSSISSAHILCYAIILLNSDLHNPSVPRHMTQDEFVHNLRPSITPKELSDSQLAEFYHDIRQNPLSFNSSASDQFLALCAPRLRGFLKKKSNRWNSFWTNHFFVLTNSCLYYFQDDSAGSKDTPLGMIELIGVDITPDPKKPLRIIISSKESEELQYVKFRNMPTLVRGISEIQLEAPNHKAAQKWFYRLKQSVVCSNFHVAPADASKALSPSTEQEDL